MTNNPEQQKLQWLEEQRKQDQKQIAALTERLTDLAKRLDPDTLLKRVEWLEGERRDDKKTIATLTERLADSREQNDILTRRLNDLETGLTRLSAQLARYANIEGGLDNLRSEIARQIEAADQRRLESEREADRLRLVERDGINRALVDVKKATEPIIRLEQDLTARREEERRLARLLTDQAAQLDGLTRQYQDISTTLAKLEETSRAESRRNATIQTEVTEARRRVEEYIAKLEIIEDIARRNEARVTEMNAAETDRRMKQQAWMETQATLAAERERVFVDMRKRAEDMARLPEDLNRKIEQFAEVRRDMEKTVAGFQPILDRIERRINEAAEIQRLQEEQFRQEWTAFQAEDQKKWTTHMLLRDEQWRDHDRDYNRAIERLSTLEDSAVNLESRVTRLYQTDQMRLQNIFNFIREMLADYDTPLQKAK